ncbi:MAG: integrase [Gammaproteobacteria bacterium]|nr:integrase [Gammaproteobacteria bacterium]
MTTMIAEVYEALREAGASEEKAQAAAQAIANYDNRFNRLDVNVENIKGEQRLLKWMIGFNLAFTMAILWKIFT